MTHAIKTSPLFRSATITLSPPERALFFWKERWPTLSPDLIEKIVGSQTAMAVS
jgi:hypothetical protein